MKREFLKLLKNMEPSLCTTWELPLTSTASQRRAASRVVPRGCSNSRDTHCTEDRDPRRARDGQRWKPGQMYLDSQTHWSPYLHESVSKWTHNVSLMCEEGCNSSSLCSSEVQLFILSGHRYELRCNLIRHQQYSMRGRDNTLTANGLEHWVQFHRTLCSTCSAYCELAASTETGKSLWAALLFVFRYQPCKHLWPQKSKDP